eukprot:jgi/Psemu1/30483/gm1.30483_g
MGLGTKKRWRIGGRNKSKSKKDKDDAATTAPSTPESSDDSHGSGEDCNDTQLDVEVPVPMSDVDDSDDSDDDLYLDKDKDVERSIDKIANLPEPPTIPITPCYDDNDTNDQYSSLPTKQLHEFSGNNSNIDDYSDEEDRSNYEEDMERHRKELRTSPFMSEVLHKIEEESHPQCDADNDNEVVINKKSNANSDEKKESVTSDDEKKNSILHDKSGAGPTPQRPKQVFKKVTPKTIYRDKEGNIIHLPPPRKLSKELCKIVATDHYSGTEFLRALERLSEWAHTQDTTLLKHFLTYGGVVKVVDFLREQVDDPRCEGDFLMECIHKACDVICNVCFVGKHGINEDIAVVNATVVVKYEGIEALLLASNQYNESNRNNRLALKASEGVWNAIMNVYCNAEAAINKNSVDHPIAAETIANVFNTYYRITYHGYVTKDEFKQMDILTHCLDVFKGDVTCSESDEELLEEAVSFFYGCHEKGLFTESSDYERILPLCVMGLREFAQDNANIREWATKLLDGACSNIRKKETIMMAEGAIEALAPFLTSKDIDAKEKDDLRKLIRKIIAASGLVPEVVNNQVMYDPSVKPMECVLIGKELNNNDSVSDDNCFPRNDEDVEKGIDSKVSTPPPPPPLNVNREGNNTPVDDSPSDLNMAMTTPIAGRRVSEKQELYEWVIESERLNLFSWRKENLIKTRSRVMKDIYATVPEIEGDGFEPHLIDWCCKKLISTDVAGHINKSIQRHIGKEENLSFSYADDSTLPVCYPELQGNIDIDKLHHSQWWINTWEKRCNKCSNEILVPIILYMNGIAINNSGQATLTPLNMTLGIFNTLT